MQNPTDSASPALASIPSPTAPDHASGPRPAGDEIERVAEAAYRQTYGGNPPLPWMDSVMESSREWYRKGVCGLLPEHEQRPFDAFEYTGPFAA